MLSDWYLIQSKPKQEFKALEHLTNQSFETFLPLLKINKIRQGRQTGIIEPLFPRYIFVNLKNSLAHWHKIRSTRGVIGFVEFSGVPASVPLKLIKELKEKADSDGIIDDTLRNPNVLKFGDIVEITEGSFTGCEAIVKEQDSDQRVTLLITLLGSQQMINMPISAISPISY